MKTKVPTHNRAINPKKLPVMCPEKLKKSMTAARGGERNRMNAVAEDDALPSPTYYKRLSKARQKTKDHLEKKVEVIRKRDKVKLIWTVEKEVHPITPPLRKE